MKENIPYIIRQATPDDAHAVHAIAKGHDLALFVEEGCTVDFESRGFLYPVPTVKEYARLLRRHPMSLVLTLDGRVAAYVIASTEREQDLSKMVNREILIKSTMPFVTIEQMAAASEHMRNGYGRALCKQFIVQANADIYASVPMDADLENIGAAAFFKKMGFEKSFEVVCEDDLNRFVYRRFWGTNW